MLLGCIGDDFTGSGDLANTLAKGGMHSVLYTGVPDGPAASHVEAGVVALKSRSIHADAAIEESLAALAWLREQGCQQFFFKYCSTFDSTPEGNIGPVCEALAAALDASKVVVCPAFPGTGRSLYQGHLFVNDVLLNESGMEKHPLTPMIDADIRRWLGSQTRGSIGHVAAVDVLQGAWAIGQALEREHQKGHRLMVVDAMRDEDLREIGTAVRDQVLVTGGSGVALGLPRNFSAAGELSGDSRHWQGEAGQCVVLSGSCSNATRAQVARHLRDNPGFEIRIEELVESRLTPAAVVDWCLAAEGIPMAYSSADPQVVERAQAEYGRERSAEVLESFFADMARLLVASGTRKLLTAGGETSGAIVEALAPGALEIGPEIDPGVPALRAGEDLVIALKSGNFGSEDYFVKAADILSRQCKAGAAQHHGKEKGE